LNCPRCTTSELLERDRDGITVDHCPDCRGIWLDRGELERLLARAAAEDDERGPGYDRPVHGSQKPAWGNPDPRRTRRPDDDDDDDDDDHDHRRHQPGRPGKPRRWFESLGDLFD
jgi:Zn-finger nucleic acid-binding protein